MGIAYSSGKAASEQYGIVYGTEGYLIAKNINNVDKIEVYNKDRELKGEVGVPPQITGFEDQVRASMKAIREGRVECEEVPHQTILKTMKLMDSLRAEWGIKYPFE
jgi:predicted dehydrogenase